jgi:hypothetical protein
MDERSEGMWIGWGGMVVFLSDWLLIPVIAMRSIFIWGCIMALAVLMCVYGARTRSRWFWIPAVLAASLLVAFPYSALHPESR